MERYSTLWGTEQSGPYRRLGTSKRLGNFLTQKIGAANIKDVVELTEKLVTGIAMLPGYENETLINKPLAVVYAPLYLEKKPGMTKGMKGFCALGISGLEHRDGMRESAFSHTWFFPREDMLAEGEFNYLDLLMGTRLTNNQDVALHREGSLEINMEQLPQKVQPVLVKKDMTVVLSAIDALYQKKNVVLVLENGVNFNSRSMALLTQIYSMMQPVMATETGFATYQSQKRILELSADTNVQIYLVPAGSDLSGLPASKFEILNVAGGAPAQRTPVTETLTMWLKLDWKSRSRAMMHLFKDSSDYTNADQFVKLSREFIAQAQDLSAWASDTTKHKTITSLAELKAEDKTETSWKLVPWAKETFEKKIPALLKDTTVESLNARSIAAFYEYNGADAELKKRSAGTVNQAAANSAAQQYQYGRKLAGANEAELCRLIWEKADERVGVGYRNELAAKDAQIAGQAAQHEQAVAGLKQTHQLALQAKDNEIAAQAAEFAQKEEDFKTALSEREQGHRQELERRDQAHEAALTKAVSDERANTAAVQAKLDAADQVHAEEIGRLNQSHADAVGKLNQDHQTAMQILRDQAQKKVNELKGTAQKLQDDLTQANTDKQNLKNSLDQSDIEKQNLQNRLDQADAEKQKLQSSLSKVKTRNKELEDDMIRASEELQDKNTKLSKAEQDYANLQTQFRQATGQEPAPPPESPLKKWLWIGIAAVVGLILGGIIGAIIGRGMAKDNVYAFGFDTAGKGTVSADRTEAGAGDTIIITVTPDEGWQLDGIKGSSDVTIKENGETQYILTMPEHDEEIVVTFSEIPAPVFALNWSVNGQTGDAGEMGTVSLSHTEAKAGETITVTVMPAEGWKLSGITCKSGTAVAPLSETQYTFTMPEGEETVQITFSELIVEPVVIDEAGEILWETVQTEVSWIVSVETDTKKIDQALGEDKITDEAWSVVAMLAGEEADPSRVLVLRAAEEGADALTLLKPGALVLDNGEYVLLIPAPKSEEEAGAWNSAVKAGRKLMDLLCGESELLSAAGYMLEDERVVDLQALMTEAGMTDGWWMSLNGLSLKNTDRENLKALLGSSRVPTLVVKMADELEGAVFDYYDDPETGDKLVGIAEGNGRKASHVEDFVLVLCQG